MGFHLAQLNLARLLHPLDDPRLAEFVEGLAIVNRLADHAPGFVWRLQSEEGDATGLTHPWSADPFLLVNMSVWRDPESLKEFVYKSGHLEYYLRRLDWFEKPAAPHYVLWWVPEGHQPSLAEAQERLEHYRRHGATPDAFWFGRLFPAPAETSASR